MHNHKNKHINNLLHIMRKANGTKDIFDEINNSYVADTVNRVNDVDRESGC